MYRFSLHPLTPIYLLPSDHLLAYRSLNVLLVRIISDSKSLDIGHLCPQCSVNLLAFSSTPRKIVTRQDCKQLYQFLDFCQRRSIADRQVKIASITLEIAAVDPLTVLQHYSQSDRLHFYAEKLRTALVSRRDRCGSPI